jgi:hypothetical protein
MKYNRLPQEELEKLEKEFVDFLVVNGITAEDWETIKQDHSKANDIIDQFSDVIWEGILRKAEYLEFTQGELVYCFWFEPKLAHLVVLKRKDEDVEIVQEKQSKPYKTSREMELFKLIQSGALITEGELFRSVY